MKFNLLALALLSASISQAPAAMIAENGVARTSIVIDPSATTTEAYAAHQLAVCLHEITGATIPILTNTTPPAHAIMVGFGAAASAAFKDLPSAPLGDEELLIRTEGDRILLAGGRPRGTLYAVSRFLQDACGVRWWTPWATHMPHAPTLRISDMNLRDKPAFEYRDPYWHCAFNPDWSWHNFCNGQRSGLTPDQGGCVTYKYFVHSFYTLVPPKEYFPKHPEWFSLINGHRTAENAQLCLSNPQLRDFVVVRVKEALRESPKARIISVWPRTHPLTNSTSLRESLEDRIISISQNDCFNPCECPQCKALDDAEESHAGSVIAFVNYIAERIEPEFPNVTVDTLAYQYTRKPPRTLRPRSNVVVRLCNIECNFREWLGSPSNASFAADIHGWAQRTDRLYIWDYVTDFAHYLQPFPNWYTLGPDLRFYRTNHVRGVFDEGAYESNGAEMAEMRAWVLARLLWNPYQNERALIREFLNGYYGAAGAPLARYMDLMEKASQDFNLTCYAPTDAPFLHFKPLSEAEVLWRQAEQSVAGDSELLARVRQGHLSLQYVWLSRWAALREECTRAGAEWPFTVTRAELAHRWETTAKGDPNKPWTEVTAVREGGQTPDEFLTQIGEKP